MTRNGLLPRHPDDGTTLVELLVVMVLIGVISVAMTTAMIITQKNMRFNEDEARGLEDVRKVVERLGRDIRQARSIAPGADANHLVLWVDSNSDYKAQPNETVTWQLAASAEPGHFDVLRTVNGAATYRQATTLVSDIAFCYQVSAPAAGGAASCLAVPMTAAASSTARLVSTAMTYDAFLNTGTEVRTVEFASRLRNVS